MKLSVFITCLLTCSSIFSLDQSEQREVMFERLEALPEPNVFAFDSLRVKKFNRTAYVMDGVVTVKKDLDDTMDFTATANSKTGGQYKKIGDKKFVGFCKSMWDPKSKDYYNYIRNHSNFPEYGTCPMVAGKYWMKNLILKDDPNIPVYLPGGEQWRGDIRFYIGDELIGGYDAFLKIIKDVPIG